MVACGMIEPVAQTGEPKSISAWLAQVPKFEAMGKKYCVAPPSEGMRMVPPVCVAAIAAQATLRTGVLSWRTFAAETVELAVSASVRALVPPPFVIVVGSHCAEGEVGAVAGTSPLSTLEVVRP